MNIIVAENIKKLREYNKISLEELAKLSGVSKSMLAQIERSNGNPTVSTLGKIASGLRVPFDSLTQRPFNDFEIVKIKAIQPIMEDNGNFLHYTLFPLDDNRRFAVYYLELKKDAYWSSDPHVGGVEEFITVFCGKLRICADEYEHVLRADESIRFKADVAHSYRNIGDGTTKMHMIVYNP